MLVLCRRHPISAGVRILSLARISTVEKTPIQKVGWEYLLSQQKAGRPLSPTLSIYRPQLTWVISGFHRISGCIMTGALFVGVALFDILPFHFTSFIETIRSWNLPWIVLDPLKFVIAFFITFHTLNGIRFLGFDLAKGITLPAIYKSGWIVTGASVLISLAVVIIARLNYGGKHPGFKKVHNH